MKSRFSRKCTAFLLLLATLVGTALPLLSSCDSTPPATTENLTETEATTTEEELVLKPYDEETWEKPNVATGVIPENKNLVLEMEKIPIANDSMTEAELRAIILRFAELQLTFAYTPDLRDREDYGYYVSAIADSYGADYNSGTLDNCKIMYYEEKYYGGIPYMGQTHGSVYRWLPLYDAETGLVDWEPIINTRRINYKDKWPDGGSEYFGNTCSSNVFWAFARVTNKLGNCWTAGWGTKYGYVKVGDFDLPESGQISSNSKDVTQKNGRQKMYRAYALVKGADGLVHTGHAIMAVKDAHVVYNTNGTINGDESYIIFCEQKASFLTASPKDGGVDLSYPLNSNGVTYRIQGNWPGTVANGKLKEMKWTFTYLYEHGWLPFTIPELVGQDPIEKATATMGHNSDTIKLSALKLKTVTSNYYISDVQFTVLDKKGNKLFNAMYAEGNVGANGLFSLELSNALFNNPFYSNKARVNLALSEYADKDCTLIIDCRVSTGELIRMFEGTLTQ